MPAGFPVRLLDRPRLCRPNSQPEPSQSFILHSSIGAHLAASRPGSSLIICRDRISKFVRKFIPIRTRRALRTSRPHSVSISTSHVSLRLHITGSRFTTPALIGTFSDQPGLASESECTACTAGSYCADTGQTTVQGLCAEGYYCPSGSEVCCLWLGRLNKSVFVWIAYYTAARMRANRGPV